MGINPVYAWALVVTAAAAVVALAINVQLAFFMLLFAIVAWWAWVWPLPAIYLLVVLAPLLPMLKITQTIGTLTLIKDVIILVLFTRLFLLPLLMKQLPYRRNILFGPIAVLVGWVALAMLRARSPVLGVLRARDIVLYVLLYFAVLYLPRSKIFYRHLLGWFLISAFTVGLLGWYQFYFLPDSAVLRFDPAREIWIPRVSSVMAHPSIFGQYLVTVSLILGAITVQSRRYRWWALLGFIFFGPLVYYTYSRAVWLGYAAGIGMLAVAWLWARARQRFVVPWRALSVVAIVSIVIASGALRFSNVGVFVRSAFDPTYESNAERIEFLSRLISPLTPAAALVGTGLGDVTAQNFRDADVNTFDIASGASRTVQLAKNTTLVDNQWLKTFIEMGLSGVLIYCWLYWRFLKYSWALSGQVVGLAGVGFVTALVIQAFFIDIWDIFPTNAAFWILAALTSRESTKAI